MPQRQTLRVSGMEQFLRATDLADRDSKRFVRSAFREIGADVRNESQSRFMTYDARSAERYRVIVRRRGVSVEQVLRRTTGLRGDFGALQMKKALVPALVDHAPELDRKTGEALDKVADHFEARLMPV